MDVNEEQHSDEKQQITTALGENDSAVVNIFLALLDATNALIREEIGNEEYEERISAIRRRCSDEDM